MTIHRKLRDYQKAGRDAALNAFKTDKGFLIGDEMGLGKSIQSLAVADKIKKKFKRIAIICPAGLVEKWKDEIKKHLPKNRDYAFSIASYNELAKPEKLHFFTSRRYDLTICDEAHYLKGFESQRTRAILGAPEDRHRTVASVSEKLIGLSGTWPPNRVGETYPWLYRTGHPLTQGLTHEQFLYKYAAQVWETGFGTKHKGVKDPEQFRELLNKNFIYRKTDDVEKDIPKFTAVSIPIECGLEIFEEEKKLLVELLTLAGHPPSDLPMIFNKPDFLDLLLETVPSFDRLSEFRKRQGLLKIKPVSDYLIESVLPETKKFILFCYHRDVAEKYRQILAKAVKAESGQIVHLITGNTSDKTTRFKYLQEIDRAPQAILIATIDAVREGFDLTGFRKSFYAESDWRTYAVEQSQGRTRRIGQTKPGFWFFFNLAHGVESLMAKRLVEKTADLKKIRGK